MKRKSMVIVSLASWCFLVAAETSGKTKKPIVLVTDVPRPRRNLPTNPIDCSEYKNANGVCPKIYAPVCGTDGKTYGNKCMLCCEILSGKKINMAYKGQCIDCSKYPQPREGTSADCPEDYLPVCDADGNMHGHICILCAQIHTTGVKIGIIHTGKCN